MSNDASSEKVFPPPIILFLCLLVGLGLDYMWPYSILPLPLQQLLGGLLICVSLLIFGWALLVFIRSNTSLDHRKPTTELIAGGPFRYSRNPIYLSMTVFLVGCSVLADSVWNLLMVIVFVLAIHYLVILKEEAFLKQKFGESYTRYMAAVRRWI